MCIHVFCVSGLYVRALYTDKDDTGLGRDVVVEALVIYLALIV